MVAPIDHPVIVIHSTTSGSFKFDIDLEDFKTIMQRALNTWSDVPEYLLRMSDVINELTSHN